MSPAAPVRFSAIVLPDDSPAAFLRTVREVEAAGVERLWTYDHPSWRHLRDEPWFAAMPLLAAAAACTSTIRLGPLVATPNFRHPVPFAKEVMTLDHLAGGRLDLGVGAGADGPDAAVLGDDKITARQRADRFRDWVELLVTLLEQERVTATAGPYTAVDARMIPGCRQRPRPPLTVAASGPRGMALAVRFAHTWVSYGDPRNAAGDGHDGWLRGLRRQSRTLDDTLGRLAAAGFDDVYALWPRPDGTGMPVHLVHRPLERRASADRCW